MNKYDEAINSYRKFIKNSKGIFGINFGHKGVLKKFVEAQKENGAYTNSNIGLKNVELSKIVGSVQKYMDFHKNFVPKNKIVEERWCNVYVALSEGMGLPPIELYKVKEEYYVYDGNHRVSVANFSNFKYIEAEVKEFIPSADTKENAIYREKIIFERLTKIENIMLSEVNRYSKLTNEVKDFKVFLLEKERKDYDLFRVAEIWKQSLYSPSLEILKENEIIDSFENKNLNDLFSYFLDHKYFLSEKRGQDVGYIYALIDFINLIKSYTDNSFSNKFKLNKNIKIQLEKLQKVENKKFLDAEIIEKNEILKEVSGIEFDHNFFILYEVDLYMEDFDLRDFREGSKRWYEKEFLKTIEIFKEKVGKLPSRYSNKLKLIIKNKEKLFYSLQKFSVMKIKSIKSEKKWEDVIVNYILEVYIAIVEILIQKSIENENLEKAYFGIEAKYNYLIDYKKDIDIVETGELYFKSKGSQFERANEWFGIRMDIDRSQALKKYMLTKFREQFSDKTLLKEIFSKYGKPSRYSSILKLEKFKKDYDKNEKDRNWLKECLLNDLEKMSKQDEIIVFYKTKAVLEEIKEENVEFSFVDFYSDIISYGNYLERDLEFIDILDLILEYKNR